MSGLTSSWAPKFKHDRRNHEEIKTRRRTDVLDESSLQLIDIRVFERALLTALSSFYSMPTF